MKDYSLRVQIPREVLVFASPFHCLVLRRALAVVVDAVETHSPSVASKTVARKASLTPGVAAAGWQCERCGLTNNLSHWVRVGSDGRVDADLTIDNIGV